MIDEILTAPVVTIDTDRCVNNRHDRAGCSRCADACPTVAIRFTDHLPSVVTEQCVRCGACSAVCPTDAVNDPDAMERRLVATADDLDATSINLTCIHHPNPIAALPGGVVVRHARCLAALDAERFIALTRNGCRTVNIDLSWCDQCPLVAAAHSIAAAGDAAAALLALAGADRDTIRFRTPQPTPADAATTTQAPAPVVDSWRPAMSRRGMFATLRTRARDTAERAQAAPPTPLRRTRGRVATRLPHSVADSRLRLLRRLSDTVANHGTPVAVQTPASLVPFAEVNIDERSCSGCGLCARYCPTGALICSTDSGAPADGGTRFALSCRPSACIDCGICSEACPEAAVTYGEIITSAAIDPTTIVELASGGLEPCRSCGLPTAARHDGLDQATCFSCRHGHGIVTALRDDAGLMADFLARIPVSRTPGDET